MQGVWLPSLPSSTLTTSALPQVRAAPTVPSSFFQQYFAVDLPFCEGSLGVNCYAADPHEVFAKMAEMVLSVYMALFGFTDLFGLSVIPENFHQAVQERIYSICFRNTGCI